MAYDPNNIFAKIIRGELPCHKLYEDEHTLSFLDIFPQSRGHTLVIPKRAGENLLDTDAADLAHAIATVKRMGLALDKALTPDGIMMGQFNRAAAGQTVFHLHFHLIPRYEGQALAGHGQAARADDEALKALVAEIKAAL